MERTVPDGGVTGGNCRGDYATDWQSLRSDSAQVAGAFASTISGGQNNEILADRINAGVMPLQLEGVIKI